MASGSDGISDLMYEFIVKSGGSMFYTSTDVAAGGVGTARTEIENHRVPDAAKTLVSWRGVEYPADQAVSESVGSIFDISGTNYKFQPQEIMGPVGGSILLNETSIVSQSESFPVFAPVNGGETISIGVEPIDAIAGNRRSAAEFLWTDIRLQGVPVIYSEFAREVAIQNAGVTAGNALNINNSHRLIEVGGVALPALPTIEEEIFVQLGLTCTVWQPVQTQTITFEPVQVPADLTADEGPSPTYLARRPLSLRFTADRATVTANYDLDVAMTAAGQAAHYIRWV